MLKLTLPNHSISKGHLVSRLQSEKSRRIWFQVGSGHETKVIFNLYNP